jgi:tetratricopeptide (TPR) repeat protein
MSPYLHLWLVIIILISPSVCDEVAYVYGETEAHPLQSGNITEYQGSDQFTFSVASYEKGAAAHKTGKTLNEIKEDINKKINKGNQPVRDEGLRLVGKRSGPRRIDQICSIYDYLVKEDNWTYVDDWKGLDQYQYANYTLMMGMEEDSLGKGDCDDFSILLAALVESVGGTPRIIFAYGPKGGHAYTEVYLGKDSGPNSDVSRMIKWLRTNYGVKEIYTHNDSESSEVWLNLDWWKEPGGAKHPGGPFFIADYHIPVYSNIIDNKEPLTPLNERPQAQITIFPSCPIAREEVFFNASLSKDIGGRIEYYEWDFGEGNGETRRSNPIANYTYTTGGRYNVSLKVMDDQGSENVSLLELMVNNPPEANFTILPEKPKAGDWVTFDASSSEDAEDGKNIKYYWEIDNNTATDTRRSSGKREYERSGIYWINLTVTDQNGAKGFRPYLLRVNEPPIAHFIYDKRDLNVGKEIDFNAASSKDPDGKIIDYTWDFGDSSAPERNQTVKHSYSLGGRKTIEITVEDNGNATSTYSEDIHINLPPIATFSCEPLEPQTGDRVIFNASGSEDPEDGKMRYIWDFGEGREPDTWIKPIAKYTYEERGDYEVILTAIDDDGAKSEFRKSVVVIEKGVTKPTSPNTSITDIAEGREPPIVPAQSQQDNIKSEYDAGYWNIRGTDLNRQGLYEDAIDSFDKAIEIDPTNAKAWNNKGYAFMFLGNNNESLYYFNKAIDLDPKYAIAWNNKATALINTGMYEEAIYCSEWVIEMDPNDADAWNNKGTALMFSGYINESIENFDIAIGLNAHYSLPWSNKAFALIKLDRYDEAIYCGDMAIEIDPLNANAWNNKGVALMNSGEINESLECFNRAIEINPSHKAAINNRDAARKIAEDINSVQEIIERNIEMSFKTFA